MGRWGRHVKSKVLCPHSRNVWIEGVNSFRPKFARSYGKWPSPSGFTIAPARGKPGMVPPWLSFSSVDLRVDLRGSQESVVGAALLDLNPHPAARCLPALSGLRQADQRLSRSVWRSPSPMANTQVKISRQYIDCLP